MDQPVLPGFLCGDVGAVRALHLFFNEDGESIRAGLPGPAEIPRYGHGPACCCPGGELTPPGCVGLGGIGRAWVRGETNVE